jgi:hypothetical protein
VQVSNHSEWRDGMFSELYGYGRILSKEERERVRGPVLPAVSLGLLSHLAD